MKFNALLSDFTSALKICKSVSSNRNHETSGVLITANEHSVNLTSFDTLSQIRVSIACKVIEQGSVLLHLDTLLVRLSLITQDVITITDNEINDEFSRVSITSLYKEDFYVPDFKETTEPIDIEEFKQGLIICSKISSHNKDDDVYMNVNCQDNMIISSNASTISRYTLKQSVGRFVLDGKSINQIVKIPFVNPSYAINNGILTIEDEYNVYQTSLLSSELLDVADFFDIRLDRICPITIEDKLGFDILAKLEGIQDIIIVESSNLYRRDYNNQRIETGLTMRIPDNVFDFNEFAVFLKSSNIIEYSYGEDFLKFKGKNNQHLIMPMIE